tara:strand:+ start:246 stop:815 length:570 start_codon:yes stop_codon:yes gene_type:complete
MPHYFTHFPKVSYDMGMTGSSVDIITNPLARFKILDSLKSIAAVYYTHNVSEGQSAQFIAKQYYEDETLDWVLYLVNDIIDPLYDWPLDYHDFLNYIKKKYGRIETAMNTVHHYEWTYQEKSIQNDGTVIPEKKYKVDQTTYNTLSPSARREVSDYTYEEELNNAKREIKILKDTYIPLLLTEVERVFR